MSGVGVFETLSSLVKPLLLSKGTPKIKIDEWSFRVHYRLTSLVIFLFCALICMKEFLGDQIQCVHMSQDIEDPIVPRKVMETYCFIMTTFTVPYDRKTSSVKMDQKTISSLGGPGYVAGGNERKYHAYYQWVPFYLFMLALLFLVPHAIWKAIDNSKLKYLVQDLNVPELPVEGSMKCNQVSLLASYLINSKGQHKWWANSYILCEIGNLVCLLGAMYLTDVFLGKEFSSYGPEVLRFLEEDPEDREDPMSRVFPRITKCNLHTYGPSGSIQRFDALCVLSSNILNEKIFTFLWFWLVMVSVVTAYSLLCRIVSWLSLKARVQSLGVGSESEGIVRAFGHSDWLLLRLLRLNVDEITFDKLILSINQQLIM